MESEMSFKVVNMEMKKDDIYKEFITNFVRDLIKGNYDVRNFCHDYSAMERKIYNDAKKIASDFVDNFEENINNLTFLKESEKEFEEAQQEKFNQETFDKFKSFVLKGIKSINYPCIGCKVGDGEDCNCDFSGYEVIFDERRGIWNLHNDYNYSDDFKNKTLYLQFRQYTQDPQMMEEYNGVGYYFYGKKICDFDYDELNS